MRTDVMGWIDCDVSNINKAFDNMEMLLSDLNMRKTADDIIEALPKALSVKFDWENPTKSIILAMYSLATTRILDKYPNAKINIEDLYGSCYNASINVDDATLAIADEEYRKEFEE